MLSGNNPAFLLRLYGIFAALLGLCLHFPTFNNNIDSWRNGEVYDRSNPTLRVVAKKFTTTVNYLFIDRLYRRCELRKMVGIPGSRALEQIDIFDLLCLSPFGPYDYNDFVDGTNWLLSLSASLLTNRNSQQTAAIAVAALLQCALPEPVIFTTISLQYLLSGLASSQQRGLAIRSSIHHLVHRQVRCSEDLLHLIQHRWQPLKTRL
jgi:hypothetical protein